MSTDFGVSEVVGFALLVGLSVSVSTVLFVSAGGEIDSFVSASEREQVETRLIEFASEQSRVGLGGSASGSTVTMPRTGEFELSETTVEIVDADGEVVVSEEVNVYEYAFESDTYYVVSGGVFRVSDSGGVSVIADPLFDYSDDTVTFPVVSFSGSVRGSGGSAFIENDETVVTGAESVFGDEITVRVTGDEYRGWEAFFKNEVGVSPSVDGETVSVVFGFDDTFSRPIEDGGVVNGELSVSGNGSVTGDVTAGSVDGEENVTGSVSEQTGTVELIDSEVIELANEAESDGESLSVSPGDEITDGLYYHDGDLTLDSSVTTINADDGSVEIIVDGSVEITDSAVLEIINTTDENIVEIIALDGYTMTEGSPEVVTEEFTGHHRVYVPSNEQVKIEQSASFDGIILAPSGGDDSPPSTPNECTSDVCIQDGSATVNGSVIAGTATVEQSGDIQYDDELSEYTLNDSIIVEDNPEIQYYNFSVNKVKIE